MLRERKSEREFYIQKVFAPENDLKQKMRLKLQSDEKEGINIGPDEGKLLQLLLRLIHAQTVVEIGLLYGYSTLWIAECLPPDGKVISVEKDEDNFKTAKSLLSMSPHFSKIDLKLGDATQVLEHIQGPVDAVFIDANKAAYCKYLDWAEMHVRPGGLIIGDNTFLFGKVYGPDPDDSDKALAVMRQFNQRLADSKKFDSILIPTIEGLTVAIKK